MTDTPWRRDPGRVAAGLEAWARARLGGHAQVGEVSEPGSGMANDTVLFRLDGERLVARLAPAPESHFPTFPEFDLVRQRRVIDLVRALTALPAPEVVHVEEDDTWLGVPFMVVRAIDGEVASDNPPYLMDPSGWFLRGSDADRERMERSTIGVFVELHRIEDGDHLDFLRPGEPGGTALERLFASYITYSEWAREGRRVPVLERAIDVLGTTMPANDRAVLLWGDGRPGNLLYRDFEPVGVLDWEMAGVGPPEADVAWTTFFQRFFAHMAERAGVTVPAMFERHRTARTYESLGGVALDDLAWYEALAGLRFGTILVRMYLRGVAYGQMPMPDDPDELVMFAPLLARLLDDL